MVEVRIAASSSYHSYEALKQVAFKETYSLVQLEQLKNIFKNEISSQRRRECIRNITDLIVILEKRDILSEYNVDALQTIANQCNISSLQEALNAYSLPDGMPTILNNEYYDCRLAETLRQNLRLQLSRNGNLHPNATSSRETTTAGVAAATTTTATSQFGPITEQKRNAIYKKLSKELGSYWRSFGRELNIGEGDMDNIELQFPRDISSRIYKLLQLFEEDDCHDPKKHFLLICRALDECKRKDLRRAIEDIMSH